MKITNRITLDFGKSSNIITISAKQGDKNSRYILITPMFDGEIWKIPNGTRAFFAMKKPDGKHVYNEQSFENDSILVKLTDQTLVVAGKSICTIVLLSDKGEILSTQNFNLEVEYSPGVYAELESTDEVKNIHDLIEYINDKLEHGEFNGKSAYEYAVEGGYSESEEEFYNDLGKTGSLGGGGADLSDKIPQMDGEASAGVSDEAARADHVHPSDDGKMDSIDQMSIENNPDKLDRIPLYDFSGKTMKYVIFSRLIKAITDTIESVSHADTADYARAVQTLDGEYYATLPEGMTSDGVIALASDIAKALVGYATEEYVREYAQEKGEYQPKGEYLIPAVLTGHNTATDSHNDIRLLIDGLTSRLNALADSDDDTLDQLSEVVAYIKDNRELIESVTTSKVNVADIVDNLTTNVANKPLSAAQGVALKALIDALSTTVSGKIDGSIMQSAIKGALASYKTSAQTEAYVQSYAQPKGSYVTTDKTITVTGVDEDGVTHTWTIYGVKS